MASPLTVAVTGASGFIGRHFAEALAGLPDVTTRVLVRHRAVAARAKTVAVPGDLFDGASLRRLIVPGAVVVNLAWDRARPVDAWSVAMAELAAACHERGAARLLHCSTISVYGSSPAVRVDETTAVRPRLPYERAKAAAESTLLEQCRGRVPLLIARPTIVFGPGGPSLLSLAASLTRGAKAPAFLRSCLFDHRHLHLTAVENVVAALRFLATKALDGESETFVLSEDDDPINNYRDVEMRLMRGLGVRDYAVPRVPLPPALLSALLRMRGRSDVIPHRVYDGSRLRSAGFVRPRALEAAVEDFGRWHARGHGNGDGCEP
jgi:nucleoside-diphosphate-sugar epimerase